MLELGYRRAVKHTRLCTRSSTCTHTRSQVHTCTHSSHRHACARTVIRAHTYTHSHTCTHTSTQAFSSRTHNLTSWAVCTGITEVQSGDTILPNTCKGPSAGLRTPAPPDCPVVSVSLDGRHMDTAIPLKQDICCEHVTLLKN